MLNTDHFGEIPATNGDNVVLSIDAKAQKLAEHSLAQGIAVAHNTYDSESGKYLQATGGAAIVMDPRTGRIIAMASNPTYDPSIWVGGLSQKHYDQIKGTGSVPGALFNRAIQGAYPPGSTFKTFVGAAALKQRYIGEHSALNCPGEYEVPGDTSHTKFHNWNPVNTGYLTLTSALIQSCDTFFYQLGYKFWQAYVHSGYDADTGTRRQGVHAERPVAHGLRQDHGHRPPARGQGHHAHQRVQEGAGEASALGVRQAARGCRATT